MALIVSALSFGTVAFAQAVHYDKYVSGPNEDGIFTLNLEAYATGSVTVEKKPFDIILVLDRSGSMNYDMDGNERVWHGWNYEEPYPQDRRINILREALQRFVDNVKRSTVDNEFRDAYGGHRIAFVWFSGSSSNVANAVYEGTGLNQFQNVENLTTSQASGSGNRYQPARVLLNNNNNLLLNEAPSGGTYSSTAMQRAKTILSVDNDYSDKPNRKRLVVFFTDGEPGRGTNGWDEDNAVPTANGCISAAYDIKNSTTYKATIYSVGLFNMTAGARNQTTTYLSYTSSDFTDKTQMPSSSSQYVSVSNDKSILVTSASAINSIFTSIAENASNAASGSSVLVDIVASNFNIPTNTSLGSVKVWEVPCTQQSATSLISFSPKYAADGTTLLWTNITNDPTITLDLTKQAQGEVSVKGFDYGAKWCGWDASANNNQGAVHGSKLVLEIPISVNDDIVGGPSLETNLPGSGITVKDRDGNIIEEHEFKSPVVKVPVTIWIKKEGLLSSTKNSAVQGHEDNAVFTIRKTKFLGLYETDASGNQFEGAKRIEYTYSKTGNKKFIVKGVETEIVWTTFTKVSVNMKEGNQDGIVKISGLDPNYIYRIEEDAWAHLGYDFDPDASARYTLEWDAAAGHYKDISNPFVFSNTSKTNAFYSEDVVRNVFNPGSAAPTTP